MLPPSVQRIVCFVFSDRGKDMNNFPFNGLQRLRQVWILVINPDGNADALRIIKIKINIKSLLVRCERKFDIVISLSTVKTLSNYLTR